MFVTWVECDVERKMMLNKEMLMKENRDWVRSELETLTSSIQSWYARNTSFDTTQCFDRRKYNMLMLKKTRYFDTDAIIAIIFFYHVIEFCAQERDHLLNE